MATVWEPTNKFQKWLDVELAACKAHVELGNIPQSSYDIIKENANSMPIESMKLNPKFTMM